MPALVWHVWVSNPHHRFFRRTIATGDRRARARVGEGIGRGVADIYNVVVHSPEAHKASELPCLRFQEFSQKP